MKMRVAHATLGRRRSEILGADIQPAGEALLAVDDEQLLVVAQIEKGHAPGQRRMEEARRLDAGPAQPPIGGSKEIPAADTVDQHARLDAARLGRGERRDELLADRIGAEDVAGERNAALGPVDALDHPWIGRISAERNGSDL